MKSSPIESLAPELLLDIFKEVLSGPYVVNRLDSSPWVLTFVNKKWRAVAQSCSSLWSTFIVDVSPNKSFDPRLLELTISLTGTNPLDVYWQSQGRFQDVSSPNSQFLALFQTFLQASARWRSVSFEFHSSFLNSLIPLSYHLDSLEEMNISLSNNHVHDLLSDPEYYEIDGTNLSVMLCSAPQLRRLIQWGGPPLHPIFEHLTEYSLQYDVACGLHALAFLRHILMVSHRLEELTIRRNAFLPNESLPQGNVHPVVTHTALRRLDTNDPVIIMTSNLPQLEELKIKFNNIAFSMPGIIPTIGRSHTTLTSINISAIHLFQFYTDEFIAAIHSCPNVCFINLKDQPDVIVFDFDAGPELLPDVETDGVVAVLRSFIPSRGAVPCPRLKMLNLEVHSYPCVESNLIAIRKSQLAGATLSMIVKNQGI
ncbi:hypothetical protein ARMGADRAFT_1169231 [Armillaria gallica]|uniref:F-box domain-containing protein n=1 Tax=Armillaria gallica TaxID=47427 RepID=A0A2H3DFN4_ARMGA|nr:hypothetical protein ARMGADRAFT_1169231 [Armillaria gallica]